MDSPSSASAGAQTQPRTRSITLGTWNCFGAAQTPRAVITRRGAREPARFEHAAMRAFAEQMDVLCMQELYVAESVAFFQSLSHTHRHHDSNRPQIRPLTLTGSGLGIASRWPGARATFTPFAPPHHSWEKIGRKGIGHVGLDFGSGFYLDVFCTHMQSGYTGSAAEVRARQLIELQAVIARDSRPLAATLVCGDLNIDGLRASRSGEYQLLRQRLAGFEDVFEQHDVATFDPTSNALAAKYEPHAAAQRVDYMFFRGPVQQGAAARFAIAQPRVELQAPFATGICASDHSALTVTLTCESA